LKALASPLSAARGDTLPREGLPQRPFFIGVQYHPEFKSRPDKPHPLFRDFIGAALNVQ